MTTAKHKLNQWNEITRLPVMEYKLSNGDYLVVDISVWNPDSNRAKKGFALILTISDLKRGSLAK